MLSLDVSSDTLTRTGACFKYFDTIILESIIKRESFISTVVIQTPFNNCALIVQ